MSNSVEAVVDAVSYEEEVDHMEKILIDNGIPNAREVAKRHADLMFGRIKEEDLIPVDWDKYKVVE